ncbi:hypothetical protein jhhlp_002384 [Lomentospora prolificans]|uniref:Uncharacterized protein n=1 Tax=Lomentospora prolificans TaxID=41688 RepID=A0A2N3NDX0_9PEZI|nr:hypothetical protein jhhlp_002384 [Lomentospora prolificans]
MSPSTIPLGTFKPVYSDDRDQKPTQLKRDIYLDVGEPVDDSASETAYSATTESRASTANSTANSAGSGRRRRRRKRKAASLANIAKQNSMLNNGMQNINFKPGNGNHITKSLSNPAPVPDLGNAKNRSARLHIGLNLDVELELKAKLQGDVCLTLLAESKQSQRPSPALDPDAHGNVDSELFHAHIGTIQLRQRWHEREISPSLTLAVMLALASGGFFMGIFAPYLMALMPEFELPWAVPWALGG